MKLVKDEQLKSYVQVVVENSSNEESRRITLDISENDLHLLADILGETSCKKEDNRIDEMFNVFENLSVRNR